MIDKVAVVSRRELRPNCIFNCKPIFLLFVECCFGQPIRSVYLERVRILPWLQVLPVRELHYNLFNGEYLFDFLVIILHRNARVRRNMASFNTFEFEQKIGGLEHLANLDVKGTRYRTACDVSEHIIVQIDIYRTIGVQVKRLIPKDACVGPLLAPPCCKRLRCLCLQTLCG